MLVRVDGAAVSDDAMAKAREDVKLLSRLKHDHVLRMDFVSAVSGRVGHVYEHSGGASLSQIQAAELAGGRPIPLRACVEIAAAVAMALDESGRVVQGGSRLDHPGPEPQDILIERTGRPRLSGFVVANGAIARRRGYTPPEDRAGGPAVMSWMTTQFLSELIRASGRQGEVSAPLAAAMRSGFSSEPGQRPGPGAYARTLREVAADLPGQGLRTWADVPVREVLSAARSAESQPARNAMAETVRVAPSSPAPTTTSLHPVREIAPSPTIIPDFDTEEPARRMPSPGTIIPEFEPECETEEPEAERPASEPRGYALPVSVGPSVPPPAPARPDIRTQPPVPTRPMPVATSMPPAATTLTVIDEPRQPAARQGPAMLGLAGSPPGTAGPSLGPSFGPRPSLGGLAGPSVGGPAVGPRRVDPAGPGFGRQAENEADGPDPEPPAAPSRTGMYIGLAAIGLLSVIGVIVAAAAVYFYGPGASPTPTDIPEAPLEGPLPEPAPAGDAAAVLAAPGTPDAAPPSTPAAAAPASVAPAAAPPAAPASPTAPASAASAPSSTSHVGHTSPTASTATENEPARIAAAPDDARVAPATPTTTAAPPPAAPPAPEEPGPFNVSFRPAEGDITSLEVRCSSQSGSGLIVELNQVPKATSCKITGLGGAAPLQTLVTVNAARSYTCFANGSRSCR